jgi:hypothetical protein
MEKAMRPNSVMLFVGVLFLLSVPMPADGQTMTARDYYNELQDAKGLDGFADQYVCFDNDPNSDSFFIFAQSSILRDFLKINGGWNQLSKDEQALLNNDWLILRNYTKGVATAAGRRTLGKLGDNWVEEPYKIPSGGSMRYRFAINWQTLRYSAGIDSRTSAGGAYLPVKEHYGRCEKVKP